MPQLRPDQEAARQRILQTWGAPAADGRPITRVLQQAPTAWGKGVLAASLLADCERLGVVGVFVAHLQEINTDLVERVKAWGVERVRVVMGDHAEGHPDAKVVIASVQTVARRGVRFEGVRLVIVDESHRCANKSYARMARACGPQALHLGLTATPERGDGRPLTFYQVLLPGPSCSSLVEQGIIAPMVAYGPAEPREELARDPVECWPLWRGGAPRPGILFARNLDHSRDLARRFREERGWRAVHCDADTPQRYQLVERFNAGELDILCCQRLLIEGVDVRPSQVTMLACSIGPQGPYRQALGRSRRLHPEKRRALLIDLTDNISRLGLPDDELEYHLESKAIRLANAAKLPPVKKCPRCHAWGRAGRHCNACGWELPPPPPPRLSKRELLEIHHASQRREGPEWDEWVQWVQERRAKGKRPEQISGGWRLMKGQPPRYRVEDVPVEEKEETNETSA